MPLSRYQIRNEYSLADPDLYRSADKDDPEALLEGVAMAGLVGVLRQLGDLAEFAAEIFHDLHEDVMATAARGHSLIGRVQQLEAEFPSVERRLLSQISHTSFLYNSGFDWHPNLHIDENVITRGDLPRFVMDSYEECRGPPRLFLLDKFDVAGAGACLKRYTDPSLLKVDSASSMITKSGGQREKRNRKVKRRGMRGRYGETPDVNPSSHAKLHQLLLEERIENSVNDLECRVRLKKRQLDASRFDGAAGKSYMEKFLRASSPLNTEVGVSVNPLPLTWTHKIAAGTGLEIVNIGTVSPPVARETTQADEIECSPSREEEVVKSSVHELNEITDKGITKEAQTTYESEEEKILSICVKMVNNDELAVDADKKSESTVDRYHSDDIASEIDNYMDALATMESEVDTDTDSRTKQGQQYNIRNVVHSNGSEGREQPTPFVDTCSVGNSTMSEDGNNSLKEGHSFSYSDSVRNFSVRNPDGDGVATERSSSVASLTDHGDTYSDRLSIPEEILGSDTQEYPVDGSEGVYCTKMDEASGSLRHASLSSLVHASDLADNVKENVVYSSGVPEAISREADSVSKARKNLVSAEGYDVAEMDGGDTTKPSNGLQHQQKYSHSSEDDGQLEVSHAFGDGGSACSENADSSLPILTNGKLFSSHSLNSPAEEKNQNSALSCVDACSDAAQMHHKLIVHHFEDNGELEASNGSAGVGSACADYAKDDSLPTVMDSSSLNSPAEGKNQNLAQSSVETCSDLAQVHQASIVSMLKHEDRMKPDDTLTDEYQPIPCARVSLEKLHSPLDHALSGLVEPQCTDMSHSGLIGHPESLKESAPFSADKQSIKDASTGANAEEVVTSISPLSDNSQIQHLETDLPVEGLELDSTEHCGSQGNGPAVDGVIGVYVGQVVNGDLASLLEPCHMLSQLEQRLEDTPDVNRLSEHQLDESGNIIPANDLIVEDKSGYVHANEIKHDMNVHATESVPFSLDNVPSIIESSPPISVLQEDCIPACDHNDDNGGQKDDAAASLDFSSKGTSDTVFVSVIESNPVAKENNIEGKRGIIPPSSASECLPPSPTKMKEEALLWDEDVASKGVEIQEFPPLHGNDFGAGKVASHVVDTHMNLGSTECIVACEGHSGLRLPKDGSVSSLVRESHTDLQDNIKIANFVSSEKSGQALESSFSQRTHVMEDCKDVDYFCQPGQIQSTQQINNDDWISSTPGSAPSEGPISDTRIFPGSSQYKLNISEAQVEPLTSVLSPSADETHSTKGPEGLRQDTDQSTATTSLLDMFPNATQINMGEAPPLPPLPPMQWRLGKVLHTSLVSGGKLTQHPFGSVEATFSLPTDDNTELTSQPSKGEESQYVNPFSVPSIAENVNAQLASQTSRGWDSQYVNPFLTPSTVDNADVLAVSGSSGIQPALLDPFLVSVPPMVHPDSTPVLAEKQNSLCLSSENGLQASEIEIDKPGLKPIDDEISIEDLASSHTSASTEEKVIQPAASTSDAHCHHITPVVDQETSIPSASIEPTIASTEEKVIQPAASTSDAHCHHITPVVDQETSIPSASIEPTITMLYEQKLPGGFMVPEADRGWSAYPSDVFDAGNFNGTLQKKLPRPRNPLIDAVVALDKSKLRKVGERIKPQDVSKAKEGDGLNHVQLRKVGERVKPQDAPKPEEADLRNHVQLRKVGGRVKFQDVPKREGDLRNHVQLRKVEEIVKPQDVPRPEEGDLRNHVQLRKVEETVKPQDVPKTEQGESPSHVQLRKVGDSGNRENEPNKEESRDQLLLRKAGEADKPQDGPKPDDRDSLLEQIRNKTFNLKPAAVARASIAGPKTNLKVAAILEKASNIRQAMAGSDEDDSDGWSDS